ncbi:MAG: hypothetical protein HETSPECPRED_009968 [Heterodermia speciosa]|uniref:Thaumatin-like protein n=1 Tax=Heterodermia speciosa TaxID=116794 RepID=A0A8H3IZT0_9LECA|nr:MAG: hypothetical protein HETSPECPRED_009968 [Heterodermia speciosa]
MKSVAILLLALAIPALVLGEFGYGKPRAPEITAGPLVAGRSLDERAVPLTIGISNNYGAPMSIEFDHNAGGPEPIEGFLAPRQLGASSTTQFAFPTGWAGRINVGKTLNSANSKIEASYVGSTDVDVSYVDGYSVPITCSAQGVAVAGCNIPLFNAGNTCDQVDNNGPVCINPKANVPEGPATPFFAPCQGAAYTYPKDDDANLGGFGTLIDCCVGQSCPAPARQQAKRNLEEREAGDVAGGAFERDHARDLGR